MQDIFKRQSNPFFNILIFRFSRLFLFHRLSFVSFPGERELNFLFYVRQQIFGHIKYATKKSFFSRKSFVLLFFKKRLLKKTENKNANYQQKLQQQRQQKSRGI